MKVKVNLSNQTLEYMDSQPYIQGTDTRNKLDVYIEHSSVPQTEGAFNIMIAYALQNGRTTIKMANTGATQETIDDVLYDIFYFVAPKVLTSISGNFVATLILKVNTNTYKVNVLNTVLNAVDFEAFEDALDDVSSEFIETIEGMSGNIVGLQTQIIALNGIIGYIEIEDDEAGTLTTDQYAEAQKPYCIIYRRDIMAFYFKNKENYSAYKFTKIKFDLTEDNNVDDVYYECIEVTKSNRNYSFYDDHYLETYNKQGIDAQRNNLQSQIDALNAGKNIYAFVNTYDDMLALEDVPEEAYVNVLQDETHNNSSTLYCYNDSEWIYIGYYNSYTKSQIDEMINDFKDDFTEQQNDYEDEVNAKLEQQDTQINNLIGGEPRYVNTSSNILALTTNQGVAVGTDTGHWYYWDGTQYVDGGVYQATQIGNNEVSLDKLNTNITDFINENITLQVGYIDGNSGVITPVATNYQNAITNIMYLKSGMILSLKHTIFKFYRYGKCNSYTSDSVNSVITANATEITINEDGYYIFQINLNTTGDLPYVNSYLDDMKITIYKSVNEIYQYKTDLQKFFGIKNNLIWATMDATGDITLTHSSINNVLYGIIKNTEFTTLKISAKTGYQFNYALFNHSTGAFISRSSWSTSTITLNNDYDVIVLGATIESVTINIDDFYDNIIISIDDNVVYDDLKDIKDYYEQQIDNSQFIANIQACEFDGKNLHISIDDVWQSLNDLINNTPSSIFDIAFFNSLKNWHDTYGFVFTLNVFNTQETFDISNVPNIWASEFQANKNWLKFAFHGDTGGSNYNTSTTFNTDYTKFVTQIYRITGSYDCIDIVTRLGYFGGTLSQIGSYTGVCKPIGFLGADDTRLSYYLNQSQNNLLIANGKYYDITNKYLFFRSDLRMDTYTATDVIDDINTNIKYNKYVEIFFHEQTYYSGGASKLGNDMSTLNTFVNNNNYSVNYLMDIFKI